MSKLKDGKVQDDDGNQSDSSGSKKGDADEVMASPPPVCLPVAKEADKPKPQALDLLTSTATSEFLGSNDKKRKKPTDDTAAVSEEDRGASSSAAAPAAVEGEGFQGLRSISAKRRKLWTDLLVRRPRSKDPRHLSAWLNEVLTVSEFEIPLDQIHLMPAPAAEESTAGSASSDEDKKEKKKDKKEKKGKKDKIKEKTKEPVKPKEPEKADESSKSTEETSKSTEEKSKSDEEPMAKKIKPNEKESSGSGSSSSEEKSNDEGEKSSDSKDKSPAKSPKKGVPEDDFAGSFADWRDRKKGKSLLKKVTGSLKK